MDLKAERACRNHLLSMAAQHGHVPVIQFLLANGCNVNAYMHGHGALAAAALSGHMPTLNVLIASGAEVGPKEASATPLMQVRGEGTWK